jgi:glycosyltransferase involved in cell wall biosynthesis
VLSVGEVGLRKGAPYVLCAAQRLAGAAEFRMVGSVSAAPDARRELASHVELLGALPRSSMPAQYAWADVLLLPSLCEGSSGATYEALVAGVPVVTTLNAGSLVRDGEDGFVLPIRDADGIAERLQHLADEPERLARMSRAASARQTELTFEGYQGRLLDVLHQHLATTP